MAAGRPRPASMGVGAAPKNYLNKQGYCPVRYLIAVRTFAEATRPKAGSPRLRALNKHLGVSLTLRDRVEANSRSRSRPLAYALPPYSLAGCGCCRWGPRWPGPYPAPDTLRLRAANDGPWLPYFTYCFDPGAQP
ncbi:MAG: hypothetical protein WKG07_38525 [Hymenobacter sp.]